MKKLCVLLIAMSLALLGYGQATPSKLVRVATTTTDFGVNLPAGTKIFCVADSTSYVVGAAGVASGKDIVDALNEATIYRERTTVQNSGTRGAVNYSIAVDSTKATYQNLEIGAATTSYAGVMTAADKTKLDGISASGGVMMSDPFDVADDDEVDFQVTLTDVPKDSTGVTVSLNGVELKRTTQFYCGTLSEKKITFKIPVYKYDAINVIYTK